MAPRTLVHTHRMARCRLRDRQCSSLQRVCGTVFMVCVSVCLCVCFSFILSLSLSLSISLSLSVSRSLLFRRLAQLEPQAARTALTLDALTHRLHDASDLGPRREFALHVCVSECVFCVCVEGQDRDSWRRSRRRVCAD